MAIKKVTTVLWDGKLNRDMTLTQIVSSELEQDNIIRGIATELEKRGYKSVDGKVGDDHVDYRKFDGRYQVRVSKEEEEDKRQTNDEYIGLVIEAVDLRFTKEGWE